MGKIVNTVKFKALTGMNTKDSAIIKFENGIELFLFVEDDDVYIKSMDEQEISTNENGTIAMISKQQ